MGIPSICPIVKYMRISKNTADHRIRQFQDRISARAACHRHHSLRKYEVSVCRSLVACGIPGTDTAADRSAAEKGRERMGRYGIVSGADLRLPVLQYGHICLLFYLKVLHIMKKRLKNFLMMAVIISRLPTDATICQILMDLLFVKEYGIMFHAL